MQFLTFFKDFCHVIAPPASPHLHMIGDERCRAFGGVASAPFDKFSAAALAKQSPNERKGLIDVNFSVYWRLLTCTAPNTTPGGRGTVRSAAVSPHRAPGPNGVQVSFLAVI